MKPGKHRINLLYLLILSMPLVCLGVYPLPSQATGPRRPLTVDGIKHWQKNGLRGWSAWPREIRLDVCGDDRQELFLAIGGFSRGMTYVLFSPAGRSWKLLADNIDCTAGMMDVLTSSHSGYHDFAAFQRSGRGGFLVRVYSWNGSRYIEKANWEMTQGQLYGRK